jgi:hypothetical protein
MYRALDLMSELFSAPLDDILNGSVMPYLPETTKIQERGELY